MRRTIVLIAIVVACVAAAQAQTNYSTYTNVRFAYSIAYPTDIFTEGDESDNGDGKVFRSDDGAELRVWGEHNALSRSLREEFKAAVDESGGGVTYKKQAASWFVVSGVRDGKIFYRRTLRRKSGSTDTFYTFTIEYPVEAKRRYDTIVKRIADSFRFDPSADV